MREEAVRAGRDFPGGPAVKNPPCNVGDMVLIPGQGTNPTCHRATKSMGNNSIGHNY